MDSRGGSSKGLARKSVVAGAVATAVLLSGVLPGGAEARGRRARVEVERYAPELGRWFVHPSNPGFALDEVELYPRTGERTVSVTLEDESGLPARGSLTQGRIAVHFCGETKVPVEVVPGKQVLVAVYSGACDGGAAVSSIGTLTATFR